MQLEKQYRPFYDYLRHKYGSCKHFLKVMGEDCSEWTKEDLKEAYFELEKKLKKRPSCTEFFKNTHSSIVSLDQIFGKPGWHTFLNSIGKESYNKPITKEWLINKYNDLETKLKRQPHRKELNTNPFVFDKLFGRPGWKNFVEIMGGEFFRKVWTRKSLVEAFGKLEKKLRRQPTCGEFFKETRSHVMWLNKLFGKPGWISFLKALNKKPLCSLPSKLTKEQLVKEFKKIKTKLKRQPTCDEFCDKVKCSYAHLVKLYGKFGWKKFLESMGKSPLIRRESFDVMFLELKNFCKARGYYPTFAYTNKDEKILCSWRCNNRKNTKVIQLINKYPTYEQYKKEK